MSDKAKRIGDVIVVENTKRHHKAAKLYQYVRVQFPGGVETPLLFTEREIEIATKRALKNQEDLPKVGWLKNLLD